jgi:hypothetical protein
VGIAIDIEGEEVSVSAGEVEAVLSAAGTSEVDAVAVLSAEVPFGVKSDA